MKNIFCLIIIISLYANSLFAQRCGGHITFRVSDNSKNLVFPQIKNSNILTEDNQTKDSSGPNEEINVFTSTFGENISTIEIDKISYFILQTGCGLKVLQLEIVLNNKQMNINIEDVKMEAEYLLDPIPFTEGEFVLDLKSVNEFVYLKPTTVVDVKKYMKEN